ncbi:MAG: hypothetical protein ABWZ25_08585 [Chitinophagaceae bacterium]
MDQSEGNESLTTILNEDGYSKSSDGQLADIFVQKGGSDILHSGIINTEGSVFSGYDLEKSQQPIMTIERNRVDVDVKTQGYSREGTDKKVKTKAR